MLTIDVEGTSLEFEHSLVSLSKWESEYEKPFFSWTEEDKKTQAEMITYFKHMLVSPADRSDLISKLTPADHVTLVEYINAPRTATVVREAKSKPGPRENVTSELIYYWMVSFNIPFEAQMWHLNRLTTLVRVCGVKNTTPEKEAPQATAAKFRELNEQRKREIGSKG